MTIAENIIALRHLIAPGTVSMLTATTPDGELHSRPLTINEIDDNGTLAIVVDNQASWLTDLAAGAPVNVAVSRHEDKSWVSVAGTAHLESNQATIERLWSPTADAMFPDGPTSSNVRVLRIDTGSAEYWDASQSRVGRIVAGFVGTKALFGASETIELS